MLQKDNKATNIDYTLKCYQIRREIESIRKGTKKDSMGSYEDLLKYRRGKSKH